MSSERSPTGAENSASPGESTTDIGSAVLDGSTVIAGMRSVGRRLGRWVRGSAIYGWLTAEPDPDVIVIDLRETWTVGPFLRVLDRVVDALGGAGANARSVRLARRGHAALLAAPLRAGGVGLVAVGLTVAVYGALGGPVTPTLLVGLAMAVAGLVGMRDDRDWATLRETRPVELAIAAFEPPEPPERDASSDADETGDEETEPDRSRRSDSERGES